MLRIGKCLLRQGLFRNQMLCIYLISCSGSRKDTHISSISPFKSFPIPRLNNSICDSFPSRLQKQATSLCNILHFSASVAEENQWTNKCWVPLSSHTLIPVCYRVILGTYLGKWIYSFKIALHSLLIFPTLSRNRKWRREFCSSVLLIAYMRCWDADYAQLWTVWGENDCIWSILLT